MGNLVDEAKGLAVEIAARKRNERYAAADELSTIIAREKQPRKGDRERLVELMALLGIEPEELEGVAATVRELRESDAMLAMEEELNLAIKAALAAQRDAENELAEELARVQREGEARLEVFRQETRASRQNIERLHGVKANRPLVEARWFATQEGMSFEQAREMLAKPKGRPGIASQSGTMVIAPRVS